MLTDNFWKRAELWRTALKPAQETARKYLMEASRCLGVNSPEATEWREAVNCLNDLEVGICTLSAEKLNGTGVIDFTKVMDAADEVLAKLAVKGQEG